MPPPPPSSQLVKEPNAEPIPGYRLLEPLGKGGFGEVWKCEAPGGLFKAIKFVHGGDNSILGNELSGAEQELRSLQHVKSIRHPFLLSMDRVEHVGRELVIVMELADTSLHDRLMEAKAAGRPGIPRHDLLMYLRETAEVLDLMNQEYGLQHLDIKPRNLFLVHEHVKVADFGLVNSLAELNGQSSANFKLAAITPLYASPETFLGKITLFSDQYSLAVVYCELLTGQLPFAGKNFRQLALQHTSGKPDLNGLPDADRAIVARALAKEPRQRFSSCMEFARALIAAPESEVPQAQRDTKPGDPPSSTATMHDIVVVEQRKTAFIARPTKALGRPSPSGPRPLAAGPQPQVDLDRFQFLDCLGRGPLGELWRVETPEGEPRLVKLVSTFSQPARSEEDGLREQTLAEQLRAIQHRGLLPATVIPHTANRLGIITAPVKDSLASLQQEYRGRGQAGIPRLELLGYLLGAARTLDELKSLYNVQHLGLNPRNFLLVDNEVRLSDFGLVALVWMPMGQQPAQINPRYCSPELFNRRLSQTCDQYSLALIFYELLTGDQVHGNRTPSQLARMRSAQLDSLDLLPSPDRPLVGRALHPEAEKRFPSCAAFISALLDITPGGADLLNQDGFSPLEARMPPPKSSAVAPVPLIKPTPHADARRVIEAIVKELAGGREMREYRSAAYFYRFGEEIEHHGHARLVPGTLRLKLTGFVQQWHLDLLQEEVDHFRFLMRLSTSLWKRVLGKQPGLEIDVRATGPAGTQASMTQVTVQMRPVACGQDEGGSGLEKWGGPLIDSLRTHLQASPERRKHPRLPFERQFSARPVYAAGRVGEEIVCQGKDLSLDGIGAIFPSKPPTDLLVRLRRSEADPPIDVLAQVVRSHAVGDGLFEAGLRFILS